MLETYLINIDDLIMSADEIIDFKIIRRNIWDTGLETIGFFRYKITFCDGSVLELSERLIEEAQTLLTTKYRFHWQDKHGTIIKRWDNAAHFPQLESFPHHLHHGGEQNVISHSPVSGMEVLLKVIDEVALSGSKKEQSPG